MAVRQEVDDVLHEAQVQDDRIIKVEVDAKDLSQAVQDVDAAVQQSTQDTGIHSTSSAFAERFSLLEIKIDEVYEEIDDVKEDLKSELTDLDARLEEMDEKIEQRFNKIEARLDKMEEKTEERFDKMEK